MKPKQNHCYGHTPQIQKGAKTSNSGVKRMPFVTLSLFFRCCLLVAAMMAMKWSSLLFSSLGLWAVLTSGRFFSLLPLRFGLQAVHTAPYFRQVCQSRSSQTWAAGKSYCPILQAGLSTVTGALFMRCCCSIHPF